MKVASRFGVLVVVLLLLLEPLGLAAGLSIDARFQKIGAYFEDARDHVRDGRTEAAFNDLQKVIVYFDDLRTGPGSESVKGRAWKLLGNSIRELQALQQQLGNQSEQSGAQLLPAYQNALTALGEYIRKPYGNASGELIRRRDVALIKRQLTRDFLAR